MTTTWLDDTEYEERTITSIEQSDTREGCWVTMDDGMGLYVQPYGGVPRLGDTIRTYGRGIGYEVRGIAIAGTLVRYETEQDMHARHEREHAERERRMRAEFEERRADYDAQYDGLPDVFKRRIDRFRANNPDFRWRFEPYELSCCVDAVKIAAHCEDTQTLDAFYDLAWDDQKAAIPDLFDGHSGNSFGMACRLAHHYLTQPALVALDHGALANLVGCEEYGCPPVSEEEMRGAGVEVRA